MARLQRAFFTPGAARPLKAAFFGLIFLIFFRFFLTFFCFFLRLRPWVTGVGYIHFYNFKGTLFSIMFGDAFFDSFCIDFLRHRQVLYCAPQL